MKVKPPYSPLLFSPPALFCQTLSKSLQAPSTALQRTHRTHRAESQKPDFKNPIEFGRIEKQTLFDICDIDKAASVNYLRINKFEKKLQRKIQLFRYKDISKLENKELANNTYWLTRSAKKIARKSPRM